MASWFETEKRKRNVEDGYPETKGLKDGHCNRSGCLMPLNELPLPQYTMRDFETHTDALLYYCEGCAMMFNRDDERASMPLRCTVAE